MRVGHSDVFIVCPCPADQVGGPPKRCTDSDLGQNPRRKSTRPEPGSRQTARGFGSNGVEKSGKNRGFVLFLMFGGFFFSLVQSGNLYPEENTMTARSQIINYTERIEGHSSAAGNRRFILLPLF